MKKSYLIIWNTYENGETIRHTREVFDNTHDLIKALRSEIDPYDRCMIIESSIDVSKANTTLNVRVIWDEKPF